MVSLPSRRAVVQELRERETYSERQACTLAGIWRSSYRYKPLPQSDEEKKLIERIKELAYKYKRYGCERITSMLHREGRIVNEKHIHRIWKEEGLQIRCRKRKKRRTGEKVEIVPKALYRNHVWTYDFVEDRTQTGNRLRILTVLDEYTRECLLIEAGRTFDSGKVIECLEWLFLVRGTPSYVRSDNGPEFVAKAVQEWLGKNGSKTLYIEPGSPWENGYGESFNGKFRDECLNMEVFGNVREAQIVVENWRKEYNERRPHSALDGLTPAEFSARSVSSVSTTSSLRLQNAAMTL